VSTNAIRGQLKDLLTPVVAAEGLDLEEVVVNRAGSRSVVRVVVDADHGLDLDAVAEVSRAVSAVLDEADDLLRGAYVLEVTSPVSTVPSPRRATGDAPADARCTSCAPTPPT